MRTTLPRNELKLVEGKLQASRRHVRSPNPALRSQLLNPDRHYDRVLVDAPCSNTGVMRRRVDLRWRIRETEWRDCAPHNCICWARPCARQAGGTLVYSTCSLEPEENDEVVRTSSKENPSMQFQRERTLTPWENNVDGAYVARFVRKI